MDCPDDLKADKCINVERIGIIAVTKKSETVYEGTLTGEENGYSISVVVIIKPEDKSVLVCIFKTDSIRTN